MRLPKKLGFAAATLAGLAVMAAVIPLTSRTTAAPAQDALAASRFSISIDGVEIASFSELQGITTSIQLPTVDEGLETGRGTKALAVVLRRAMNRDMSLWAWHEAAMVGSTAARKSCTLTMYNTDGAPVARYHLTDAWPSKFEIGGLKAGASEVLMETVTLTCEFIQRVSV